MAFWGYLVMAVGAWYHWPWIIVGGLSVVVLAWFVVRSATGHSKPV